jgi:hypothetical protein
VQRQKGVLGGEDSPFLEDNKHGQRLGDPQMHRVDHSLETANLDVSSGGLELPGSAQTDHRATSLQLAYLDLVWILDLTSSFVDTC